MRGYICRKTLVAGACIISGLCAWGQGHNNSDESKNSAVEIAVNFEAARANTVSAYNFWMQGGGVQGAGKITQHWSAAADISGLHTGQMPHTGVGLDLITAVFGPRYALTSSGGRFKVYGEAMGGAAHGSNSLFPNPNGATSSASGVAVLIGGGLDYRISPRVSLRMLDADWLRTALSNGTTTVQNSLRLGSGAAFHF